MTSVLITRPKPSAEYLALGLEQLGYSPRIASLLNIHPTNLPCPSIDGIQAVMITSSNAISILPSLETTHLHSLPCFCVGTQTAQKAKVFGFTQVFNADGSSRELTRLIVENLKCSHQKILHISGQHISPQSYEELTANGYIIVSWPVYYAKAAIKMDEHIVQAFYQDQLDAVLVYSSRTAETLCQLIEDNQLQACCKRLITIGLSPKVLEILNKLPWKQCLASAQPTEDAMIIRLKEICPAT